LKLPQSRLCHRAHGRRIQSFLQGRLKRRARQADTARSSSGADMKPIVLRRTLVGAFAAACLVSVPTIARADEGGVSFWLPAFSGAWPQLRSNRGGRSRRSIITPASLPAPTLPAREFQIGRIPVNLTANVSANLDARADLGLVKVTSTSKATRNSPRRIGPMAGIPGSRS
jgi:hypothetical protein